MKENDQERSVSADLLGVLNPNDKQQNKQAFAFVLRRLMEVSVCDQIGLAQLMDVRYNEWVQDNHLDKPLRKPGDSQDSISKWCAGYTTPNKDSIRFLAQALIDWWYCDEVRESCEVADYELPPLKKSDLAMLFKLSDHQPPWEIDELRARITEELSPSPNTDPVWQQQRAVVEAAKQLRRKSEKLTELSPSSRLPTTSRRLPALRKNRVAKLVEQQ